MAHYRGTVKGGRGEASRLGHKSTGMKVEAQSYSGKVTVTLEHSNGEDIAHVWLKPHRGAGTTRLLYRGPVSGADQLALIAS